jgi:hypothetical protein
MEANLKGRQARKDGQLLSLREMSGANDVAVSPITECRDCFVPRKDGQLSSLRERHDRSSLISLQ